jgi:hypothetical protein
LRLLEVDTDLRGLRVLGSAGLDSLERLKISPGWDAPTEHGAGYGEPLAALPCRPRLRKLDLLCCYLGADGLARLLDRPWPRLESLDLSSNRLGDAGPAVLTRADLPQLRELDLGSNDLRDAGAQVLAGAPFIGRLRKLELDANWITDAGALAIADAVDPATIELLRLSHNDLTPDTVRALRERFGDRFDFWEPSSDAES